MTAAPLRLRGVAVEVRQAGGTIRILDLPRLDIAAGALCGISGASGSGKTTLLHVIAGLLRPTAGQVAWGAQAQSSLSEAGRDRWRRQQVGMVFQDFQLIPELSAVDNVLLPVWFEHVTAGARRVEAVALLAQMGIAIPQRRAGLMSRGEQQRVAIARALRAKPSLILADEPTASLDADNGLAVLNLLIDSARTSGASLVVVSHDPVVLARMDQLVRLHLGHLI